MGCDKLGRNSITMTLVKQDDLELRIAGAREGIRLAAQGGAREIPPLLEELDRLLGAIQAREATLAAERKWLARSNGALEARLERLENSLVFRLLRLFHRGKAKAPAVAIVRRESSYR